MTFQMKNAPATFQRIVNRLVRNIDGCEGYIDDVVIYSDNWSDNVRQIKCFFQIIGEAKLTLTLAVLVQEASDGLDHPVS